MTTIYTTDAIGVFTGALDVDPYAALPPRSTLTPPPAVVGEQVARLTAGAWEVLPAYPAPPAPPTPTSCTPAQGLIALYALKQLTEQDILDVIAQITDPVQRYTATVGYQRATTWERGSAAMQAMAQLLGLTEADLDRLFAYASGVVV